MRLAQRLKGFFKMETGATPVLQRLLLVLILVLVLDFVLGKEDEDEEDYRAGWI